MYDQVVAYLSSKLNKLSIPPAKIWATIIFVVAVDQISKAVATQNGLVQINTGISFGWFATQPWLLTMLTVLALVVYVSVFKDQMRLRGRIHGLFLGGAISNTLDRIMTNGVRDWLPVPFMNLLNNLADWAISLAIIALVVDVYLNQQHAFQSKTHATVQRGTE